MSLRLRRSIRSTRFLALHTTSVAALVAALAGFSNGAAFAACSTNAPASGDTVLCSQPVDTVGIQAQDATDVTVEVQGPDGGIVPEDGSFAILLGDRTTLRTEAGTVISAIPGAMQLGTDANLLIDGDLMSSGKGGQTIYAEDRLHLLLGESSTVTATGDGASAIFTRDDALIVVDGTVRVTGDPGPDSFRQGGTAIFAQDRSQVLVTETGLVEALGTGAAGIEVGVNSFVDVNGTVLTRGNPYRSDVLNIYATGIAATQGSTIRIGESGSVTTYGELADGINLIGNADSYDSPVLGGIRVDGRIETFGEEAAGVRIEGVLSFIDPFPDGTRPDAFVEIGETGYVFSERFVPIYDQQPFSNRLDIDTTVRIAGSVIGQEDGLSVYLGTGNDQLVLLPTYELLGAVSGSALDEDGNALSEPGEVDRFVLDGDAGTQGAFAFLRDGSEDVLGFEEFVKRGAGRWVLNGDESSFAADGTVEGGELAVETGLTGVGFTVAGGALLSGGGAVGAVTTETGGVVAPGGEAGDSLGVAGDFDLTAGGILLIRATGEGGVPSLDAAGSAFIDNAHLAVNLSPFDLEAADGATILSAEAGVEGMFSSVSDALPDLDVRPVYGETEVLLGFAPSAEGGPLTPKGVYAETLSALLETDLSLIRRLQSRASPGTPASNAGSQTAFGFGVAPAGQRSASRFWLDGAAAGLEVDAGGGAPGFDANTGGVLAGIDGSFELSGGTLTLGLAGGYSHTSIDVASSEADADIARLGIYGGWMSGPFSLDAAFAYGRADIETRRDLGFAGLVASGDADANLYSGALAASYNVAPSLGFGEDVTIAPRAGISAAGIDRDGFDEEEAGALGLSVEAGDESRALAEIGLHLARTVTTQRGWTWRPEAFVGYQRLTGGSQARSDASLALAAADFSTVAAPVARDRLAVSAGIGFDTGTAFSGQLRLEGTYGSGLSSQSAAVGLSYRF